MQRDVNFTFLTGTIVTTPSWISLSNNKRALIFTLQNTERFKLADGRSANHTNHIVVEILGKNADRYEKEFVVHQRVQIVGYLRVDELKGEEKTRVRAFRMEDMGGD